MNFKDLQLTHRQHIDTLLQTDRLFRTETTKDEIWDVYLNAFPEGTNPMFRERTEHDCVCCKQFIRAFGNVVSIDENMVLTSIWDVTTGDDTYQAVFDALAAYVTSKPIRGVFVTHENHFGTEENHSQAEDGGPVETWNHFYTKVGSPHLIAKSRSVETLMGKRRTSFDVFKRLLDEVSIDTIDTILELIAQKSLYRGEEWERPLELVRVAMSEYMAYSCPVIAPDAVRDGWQAHNHFVWSCVLASDALLHIRNSSIGTLILNIEDGMALDDAVKKYEVVVAPSNYKRPNAIFTKSMVARAQKDVEELGLAESLPRRFAHLDDITINDILFANRDVKEAMEGDVFADLANETQSAPKDFSKVETVTAQDFVLKVLPTAETVEVLLENRHAGNMVSLIGPQNPDAAPLFKWNNNYAWAYAGNVTDGMREQVRALGGNVEGVMRFTHSWNHTGNNQSLMDLHVFFPTAGGKAVSHSGNVAHERYPSTRRVGWNHRTDQESGATQDVDHVNAPGPTFIPIENISFPKLAGMPEGAYTFKIHNWSKRTPNTEGGKAEIEFGGQVFEYDYPKPMGHHEWLTLATVTLKDGVFTIDHKLDTTTSSRVMWGLPTNEFHPVRVCMKSPNHWEASARTGRDHTFFMLKGCENETTPNGFFNEFLRQDLHDHRKVFEALGAKMKVATDPNQLSGVGFSGEKNETVTCRVTGKTTRVLNVAF